MSYELTDDPASADFWYLRTEQIMTAQNKCRNYYQKQVA